MPTTYKLNYFDVRGRSECARQIFAQANIPYEDYRVTKEEWKELKDKTPFGGLLVLEVDGKEIAQSMAVNRFLARQFGLAGKTPIEEALVDSLADATLDYDKECKSWFMIHAGLLQGDKDAQFKTGVIPARDKFFPVLQKFLKESGSGFLVDESVTWVDLLLSEWLTTQAGAGPTLFDCYPDIKKYTENVRNLPNIKKWIEQRPESSY